LNPNDVVKLVTFIPPFAVINPEKVETVLAVNKPVDVMVDAEIPALAVIEPDAIIIVAEIPPLADIAPDVVNVVALIPPLAVIEPDADNVPVAILLPLVVILPPVDNEPFIVVEPDIDAVPVIVNLSADKVPSIFAPPFTSKITFVPGVQPVGVPKQRTLSAYNIF
jgi:hypothetical protein